MEIIGLNKEEKKETSKTVGGLNTLTKALILTFQVTNKEKAEKLKQDYLNEVVKVGVEKSVKDKDKEQIKTILMMEELELEIQQTIVDTIKKAMEVKENEK